MSETGQDPAVLRNRARQVEWYGEPLGERFRRLLARLGISQAGLAEALGLSAPMLSQLMHGHRAKISNPAVLGRLLMLEELAATTDFAQWTPARRQEELARVRATAPTTSSGSLRPAGPQAPATVPGDPVTEIRALLRAVATAGEVESAAALLDRSHPDLAAFLRAYGSAPAEAARAHYERFLGPPPGTAEPARPREGPRAGG